MGGLVGSTWLGMIDTDGSSLSTDGVDVSARGACVGLIGTEVGASVDGDTSVGPRVGSTGAVVLGASIDGTGVG
jgi:hypothetical protein